MKKQSVVNDTLIDFFFFINKMKGWSVYHILAPMLHHYGFVSSCTVMFESIQYSTYPKLKLQLRLSN